ncbi:hypothetical protein [Pedobacter sp. WC2423]|uniref:hypothetical protein n=1 Tax=Pedobacter sp. WC2423 TaxID=3234142 RepID=UPI0034669F04
MEITLKTIDPVKYQFAYKKNTVYKTKTLVNTIGNGKFSFFLESTEKGLELVFRNEFYTNNTSKDPLVFSPVKLIYHPDGNLFLIKNRENLKIQWSKYKEKYRNAENLSVLMTFERLYFHTPLGLEYELASNGAYVPFLLYVYYTDLKEDTILRGMDWVHTPLNLPLRIDYQAGGTKGDIIYILGVISLDEEMLTKVIADKNFQSRAKPYHYSRNFQIQSEIKIAYDLNTGYIHSAVFRLKISGKEEQIIEEIDYEFTQDGLDNIFRPKNRSFLI